MHKVLCAKLKICAREFAIPFVDLFVSVDKINFSTGKTKYL